MVSTLVSYSGDMWVRVRISCLRFSWFSSVSQGRFWDRGLKSLGIKKNMTMWGETFYVVLVSTVTTLFIAVTVFRNVTPCCRVDEYQSFGGTCCLPANRASSFLRNICTPLPNYTACVHFTVRIPYLMLTLSTLKFILERVLLCLNAVSAVTQTISVDKRSQII
jgi:hypothetical protein